MRLFIFKNKIPNNNKIHVNLKDMKMLRQYFKTALAQHSNTHVDTLIKTHLKGNCNQDQ